MEHALEAVAAESLGRQADRRRRAGMLAGATLAGHGLVRASKEDAECWMRVSLGDDAEAAAQALQAHSAACHGDELW